MAIDKPSFEDLRSAADAVGLTMGDEELGFHAALLDHGWLLYDMLDEAPDALPAVRYPRNFAQPASPDDNPYNAWYVRSQIKGAPSGPLAGKTVVVKDCFMVAGLPMMNGASMLEGYVPEIDATVVERVLDAGATIVGKSHCEYFCASGASHSNARGPVHNPHRHGYSSGGSSSGNAALIAGGLVDMAIGSDQGGSIRMPSSFCGIYGMKPTYGLVPFTGGMSIDNLLDHAGPMTASVTDNARLLEVLAGADGLDPRQQGQGPTAYLEGIDRGVEGLRIGVVQEGFGHDISDPAVDQRVRAAADRFRKLGASVEDVSIPELRMSLPLFVPIIQEGGVATIFEGGGYTVGRDDVFVSSLMAHLHGWRERSDELPSMLKMWAISTAYIRARYGNRFYGKAVNLARGLRSAIDARLASFDLLLMPTTPMTSFAHPDREREPVDYVVKMMTPITNTCAFNITHHPAMSLPCGDVDGLPVGMMLVGRHFDEALIYRAAFAFEQAAP